MWHFDKCWPSQNKRYAARRRRSETVVSGAIRQSGADGSRGDARDDLLGLSRIEG